MATDTPAPESQDPAPEISPARLQRIRLAEEEAERLSAIMGPEWAAGMYD